MRDVLRTLPIVMLGVLLSAGALRAGDWPRWRGSLDGNGVAGDSGLPDSFDPTSGKNHDTTKLKNVKWVVPLGGTTVSSPVVAGGKVYIGGAAAGRAEAVLWCLRESDGKLLWRMRSPFISKLVNRSHGICCTPTIEGDRVYLLDHHGEVLCLDANGLAGRQPSAADLALLTMGRECTQSDIAADGRRMLSISPGVPGVPEPTDAHILWQFDMLREVNCWPLDAVTPGVLLRGDRAYVATGSTISSYGQAGSRYWLNRWRETYHKTDADYPSPSLIVLDKNTGKLLATDHAGIFPGTFHGAHATPTTGSVNGKELIFYGGGNGVVYAFDPDFSPGVGGAPGELRLVWKFDCKALVHFTPEEHARLTRGEIMSTPVFYNNRVYVSLGIDLDEKDFSPGTGRFYCIDATGSGDVTATGKVWSFNQIGSTSSTAAIAGGLLFTADAGGTIYCLDADTGAPYWTHEVRGPIWNSPVVADGKVFVTTKQELVVFAAAKEKKLLGQTKVRDSMASSPAVANGVLYVATYNYLYALQEGKTATFNAALNPHVSLVPGDAHKHGLFAQLTRPRLIAGGVLVAVGALAVWTMKRRKVVRQNNPPATVS